MRNAHGAEWLFAYGSLIWDGTLGKCRSHPARLFGYRRALCIFSHVYRGTKKRPGLVLGLMPGGSCRGVAFKLPKRRLAQWLSRIRARENVTGVYTEKIVWIRLAGTRGKRARVRAVCFVADPGHAQYAGKLPRAKILRCLRQGKGTKGRSADYLADTAAHLRALGLRDRALEYWAERI